MGAFDQYRNINFMWNCFWKKNKYKEKGILFLVRKCTWTLEKYFLAWLFFVMCRHGTGVSHKPHSMFPPAFEVKYNTLTNVHVVSYISLSTIIRGKFFSILPGYSGVYFTKWKYSYYYNIGTEASLFCKIICSIEEIPCEGEHESCFQFARPSQIRNLFRDSFDIRKN
jgi:hypothetical protein